MLAQAANSKKEEVASFKHKLELSNKTINSTQKDLNKTLQERRQMSRVIFMKEHIPMRPDRSLLFCRQTSKWSVWDVWDVVFHENNSNN